MTKRVLIFHGIEALTPRSVFREAAAKQWINNPTVWFRFLEARNRTSHIYEEVIANEIFSSNPDFLLEAKKLLDLLKKKSNE